MTSKYKKGDIITLDNIPFEITNITVIQEYCTFVNNNLAYSYSFNYHLYNKSCQIELTEEEIQKILKHK